MLEEIGMVVKDLEDEMVAEVVVVEENVVVG